MKSTSTLLAYPQLIAEIHRLSQEGQSGTIFITSDDGHLVRIILNDGRITYLAFDAKYYRDDAIPFIKNIKFGRLQFTEGLIETVQKAALPNSSEIFQLLMNSPEPINAPRQAISLNINQAVEQIKNALAVYIGPFALIVCEEYIDKVGSINTTDDIWSMINVVASEIENTDDRRLFQTQIKTEMKILD